MYFVVFEQNTAYISCLSHCLALCGSPKLALYVCLTVNNNNVGFNHEDRGKLSSNYRGKLSSNKGLTAKLLQQGYRYHKLRKTFSKFYRQHYELVSKFNVGLKTLLHQGLSEPEFYCDLVYKFKKKKCRQG